MKKVLVTGSTGMLGSQMIREFVKDKRYEVYGLGRSTDPVLPKSSQIIIDLSAPFDWKNFSFRPDIIIHTAAITNLAYCESNPASARMVHVESTGALAKLLNKEGQFIYISTDSVFDGVKGNYTELDIPNPINVYARTKLEGEKSALQENHGKTLIIRTNIYGIHIPLRNSLVEWAIKEWQSGKSITGYSDVIFNAIFTGQLAGITKHIVDNDHNFQLLNVASSSYISKYTFLQTLLNFLKFESQLVVSAKSNDTSTSIQRPANTSLNTSLLATFQNVPTLEMGIKDLINFMQAEGVLDNLTNRLA